MSSQQTEESGSLGVEASFWLRAESKTPSWPWPVSITNAQALLLPASENAGGRKESDPIQRKCRVSCLQVDPRSPSKAWANHSSTPRIKPFLGFSLKGGRVWVTSLLERPRGRHLSKGPTGLPGAIRRGHHQTVGKLK